MRGRGERAGSGPSSSPWARRSRWCRCRSRATPGVYSAGRDCRLPRRDVRRVRHLGLPERPPGERAARIVIAAGVLVLALLFLATIPLMRGVPGRLPLGRVHRRLSAQRVLRGPPARGHVRRRAAARGACERDRPVRDRPPGLRVRSATRLMRRTLLPVLAAAIVWLARWSGSFWGEHLARPGRGRRELGPPDRAPAHRLGMLAGMLTWRFSEGPALARLVQRLGAHPEPEELRDAMSDALEDPSLEIAYRVGPGTGPARRRGWPQRRARPARLRARGHARVPGR